MTLFTSTELDAFERALIAEELASSLRHDLRNKLAAVRNAAFYIQRKVAPTELWTSDKRVATFFELIDSELSAADALIGERLGPARLRDDGARASWGDVLSAILSALSEPLAARTVAREVSAELKTSSTRDAGVLLRATLLNAAEALPEGGEIRVAIERHADGIRVRVSQPGDLTDEVRARLFEPFFSTKPGRGGLGLNVARRAARRLGGALEHIDLPGCVAFEARVPEVR